MTGHWEWDDLDWAQPLAHPTIFEVYRQARHAPDTATWALVYASILARIGESLAPDFGPSFAANVVEPPTIPRSTAEEMDRLMRIKNTMIKKGRHLFVGNIVSFRLTLSTFQKLPKCLIIASDQG